jgi:hypothetical protein
MDHLPLPVDKLAHSVLTVPYICNERFSYDDNGFLSYPRRCGLDIWQLCQNDQIDLDEWAPFLQAWLWFGLLGETISIGSRTHVPQRIANYLSFVEWNQDATCFVVTKDLQKSIELAAEKNQAPLFNEFHRNRFDTCLAAASQASTDILSTPSCRARLAKATAFTELPVFYSVLLSVQILIETLSKSRVLLFHAQPLSILASPDDHRPSTELVDILLKQSGWCPAQIPMLSKDIRVRYYLSYLHPYNSNEHQSCSKDECRRHVLEEAEMRPLHTSAGCECSSVFIPDDDIIRIAEDGDIPLITFSESSDGQRRLGISRYSHGQSKADPLPLFVAVTHVRQIGLGNTKSHSLPYCQLSSLQMIANELLSISDCPTPFWIDTACLPLRRDMKKQALRKIHRVYQSASKAIILDPSLFQSSVGSAQDALFRIRYSQWKGRLWTLQEGVLANELFVRFRNRTYNLEDLIQQYEKSSQMLLVVSSILQGIDNERLNSALAAFDQDIKTVVKARALDVDQHRIRTILRLGYLASPLYRYFREDWETEGCILVVRALLNVYPSSFVVEEAAELSALASAIERVNRMSEIKIKQGL